MGNQELEKFKFVLDYKIKELKAQIDPKNDDIAEMRQQIEAMDYELEEYQRKKKKLFADLMLIKRFKLDLDECIAFASEPKHLKEAVAALFRKYVQSGVKKLELDADTQKEYNRQRDYLEKSVDSLKRKLAKDSEVHRIDNMRIMQENVSLIREINDLRREINYLKHERSSEEQGGGMRQKEQMAEKELMIQQEELENLRSHLMDIENTTPRVGSAGTRLPPLATQGAPSVPDSSFTGSQSATGTGQPTPHAGDAPQELDETRQTSEDDAAAGGGAEGGVVVEDAVGEGGGGEDGQAPPAEEG